MILKLFIQALLVQAGPGQQKPLGDQTLERPSPRAISTPLFASLERLARLVDTSYCLGSTGIHKPFDCLSRCKDFPSMKLTTTWSTGILFGDNCGFIAVDYSGRGAIVVAFRGTYSIANTIVDLATLPQRYVPYPSPDHGGGQPPEDPTHECKNCTVHMGFLHSWRSARGVVLPELEALRAKHPGFPIRVIGHSLGGSVACLAALELKVSRGWEDVEVTTFGEPRVGNGQLARFVDAVFALDGDGDAGVGGRMYRRVTHRDDPVPLLPPTEMGFRSHGGEIFIAKSDLSPTEEDVVRCTGDEDPACSAGADESVVRKESRSLRRLSAPGGSIAAGGDAEEAIGFPTRFRLWQILFAHRDYFWRLGLCIPGGDPFNWGRSPYAPEDGVE